MADMDRLALAVSRESAHAECPHLPPGETCGGCILNAVNRMITSWRENLAETVSALSVAVAEPENAGYAEGYADGVEAAVLAIRGDG